MFNNLSEKLDKALHVLKGHGRISEINVAETLKEVRRALLDADVNYKIAKEFTVIITGVVEILGQKYNEGDIIVVDPFESIDFKALTDVTTLVVKIPGAKNDKYIL